MQVAVHVDQRWVGGGGAEQIGHPLALFGEKTAVFLVAAPVFQVDGLVGDVQVAAKDVLALLGQGAKVGADGAEKAKLGLLAIVARGAAGKISAEDGHAPRRCVKAQFDVAPLGIKLAAIEPGNDLGRFMPRVDAHAGVAFFLCKMKVTGHPNEVVECARDVGCLGFELLHANTIGLLGMDPCAQSLGVGRADAVEVQAG